MKKFFFLVFFALTFSIYSQESLKSIEEEYFDFLSLQGTVERPTLGFRTLSDSKWTIPETSEHIWQNNNLGNTHILWENETQGQNWFTKGIYQGFKYRIYGPEWFNSYNTAVPYGQNDGALWQGRGYNTSLTGGFRLEGYGFEVTVKPVFTFNENREFEILKSTYSSPYGYFWGYGFNKGVDAPQRFGESSFSTFDLGETEIGFSNEIFKIRFGNQGIWVGPSRVNSILHSNNAPGYPNLLLGINKFPLYIPYIDLKLGDIESNFWVGYLSESKFFDNDDSNDHNQLVGISFYFSPSIFKGLILGANKICLSKWNRNSFKYLNPFYYENDLVSTGEDQKMSLSFEWFIPEGQVSLYGELGIDDKPNYTTKIESVLTHFWHCSAYTVGARKVVSYNKNLKCEVTLEWNTTEMSQDMQFNWPYNFGFHHQVTQGYTNKGQWLGSGTGYGGQSQYVSFKLYYPQGFSLLYFHRNNPDNNFLFKEAIYDKSTGESGALHGRTWNYFKTITTVGFESTYFITNDFRLTAGYAFSLVTNPMYNELPMYTNWINNTFILSAKYNF